MKQTAVEQLEEYLKKRLDYLTNHKIHIKEFVRTAKCDEIGKILELINQAKKMEKDQMNKNTNFICHGCGTKHTGENDDQMYEVCKQCFINL